MSKSDIAPIEENAFPLLLKEGSFILQKINGLKVVQVSSVVLRKKIKIFVQNYFQLVRPELVKYTIDVKEVDGLMQKLMKLTNAYTSKSTYKKVLASINKQFVDIEVNKEYKASDIIVGKGQLKIFFDKDTKIIDILEKAVPVAVNSYKQVIDDLQATDRFSYRGTVAEIREVLREVLDYLAQDKDVTASPGFKLEDGLKGPSMRQKVRFILKNRRKSATEINAPEEAAAIIDEGIEKLVRATYNRGSLATHTSNGGRSEAIKIKMYLDTVLYDLLEIHI